MKIVVVVNRLVRSGPLNVVSNLIKNIPNADVSIISLKATKSTDFDYYELEKSCSRIESINMKFYNSGRSIDSKLKDVIGEADIVHTHGLRPDYFVSRLDLGEKHVSTIHNFMFSDYLQRYGKLVGKIMTRVHARTLNKIAHPILCSGALVDQYLTKNIKCEYIDNGISSEFFNRNGTTIRNNKNQFISVGHLSTIKNPKFIANAIVELDKKYDFKMRFIGTGSEMETLKQMESDRIDLLGYQSDVKSFLNESDYFISSSTTEGLPNSALEALASEIPLILSDIPSHRYLESLFPASVLIFETHENLLYILNSLISGKLTIHKPNKVLVEAMFSANSMAKKYVSLYETIKNSGRKYE